MIEELKKRFKERDRAISVLSKDGLFRAVAIRNTNTAILAQKSHDLSAVPAYFLSKVLAGAGMISIFLKGEERVIVDFSGDGLLEKIYAEVMHVGECRGFVKLSESMAEDEINSFTEVLGSGLLRVSRILYNKMEPIVGVVPIQFGDISTDLSYYYSQSEQIDSLIFLDANIGEDGFVISSGGLMIQSMPGVTDSEMKNVFGSFNTFGSKIIDKIVCCSDLLETLRELLPFDFEIMKNKQIDFYCRCNISNFKDKLLLLDIVELEEMRAKGHNELVCQFCNKHYYLSDEDFSDLICQLRARMN